jgi:nucleoid-associated protein YgaU
MKKNNRESLMIKRNRKGVIGFLLTMAVGVALGAAALVVSNEIQKEGEKSALQDRAPSSPAAVEKAFEDYQNAYKAYQHAAGIGRKDVEKYRQNYLEAKRKLEVEIFRNTPGVSDMDMSKFTERESQTSDSSAPSTEGTSSSEAQSGNPFAENDLILTENDYSVANAPAANSATDSPAAGAQDSADSDSTESEQQTSTSSSSPTEEARDTSAPEESQITGMEYYRVKSGDSLYKICQRYYGNGGMWSHILKYQIPSIVATPNLIFPGQLIALPRGLTHDRGQDSFVSPGSTPAPDSGDDDNNDYQSASPGDAGDESWQTRFQRDYLISDHSLTNAGTMTVAEIQKFLESKGSVLAKPYRGSNPAKMIYEAAQKYKINPQVILTRLQCEQGLISKKSATQKQLDWALGVGCYDSGNWNQKFKGFDKQVEFAAATYRRHYDNAQQRLKNGENITMTIDGQRVNIKNAATYSFYKYCPHFQGNKLFYDVWNGYKRAF